MRKYLKRNLEFTINKAGHNPSDPNAHAWYLTIFFFNIKYRYSKRFGIFANDLQIFVGNLNLEFLWDPNIYNCLTWDDRCKNKGYSRRQWLSCRLYKNWGHFKYWKLFSIFESPESYKSYVKDVNDYYWNEWKINRINPGDREPEDPCYE